MKTNSILAAIPVLGTLLLTSCGQFGQEVKNDAQRYWYKETKTLPADNRMPTIDSDRASDYINRDGTGTAIPAKGGYDLYISPFAPTKGYVQSKKPEGSWVRCPYSGRMLVLGSRDVIAEKELP